MSSCRKIILTQMLLFHCISVLAMQKVIIGTGAVNEIYYPTGLAICQIFQQHFPQYICEVKVTTGSVSNLIALSEHKINFAISQLDWQHHAYNGSSQFITRGGNKKLRAVTNLYEEPFTVVTRADSHINSFDDLKGKRISIGTRGSGHRATTEILMRAKGWTMADFAKVIALDPQAQKEALCNNEIDAYTSIVEHPNPETQKLAKRCDIRLINMRGPVFDRLVRNSNYYHKIEIPGGLYRGNPNKISTFAMHTGIVTRADVDEELVYALTSVVVGHLEDLRTLTPIFNQVETAEMTHDLAVPLHSGATKYFKDHASANDILL